ncbi:MAG: type I glutamate--ammonia ligase [Sorangiineae bacterium]|nr:type I glutamate--ammonia ligase [Polyangiaceae bacterium]MEB2322001.1 type I glutamate--ammonia ligase [Sorangiineae bacterium]
MDPKEVIELGKKNGAVMVDLKFIDLPGKWQHTSVPFRRLDVDAFEDGFGFDGSSIRGFQPINQSDMLLIPDPVTAVMDPFTQHPTLSLECTIQDTITRQNYSRDPRHIARKAEAYLKSTGIADTVYFGPEAEFFIFDDVRYELGPQGSMFRIDSVEAEWNTGRDERPNLGHKIRFKEGYFPCRPNDTQHDLRAEICLTMESVGIEVEVSHHEVATAGQGEIDMRFDSLTRSADKLMWFKHIVKNVAYNHQKTATFMPKPMYGDNGNGMHAHQSLWKDGKPLFAGDSYAGLSDLALYYAGGILKHAAALAAFTNPTTNSYKRLVPGYEAPVNLAYSSRNRSAAIRIATYSASPKSRRLEIRFPDATCNPYIAFSAMLMAGLDGIQNKIDPGDPLDKDIYSLSPEELKGVPHMPVSLEAALDALERDHEFLLKGDVFTKDVIEMWLDYKRENELTPSRLYPTALEFHLYYDT